MKKNTIWVVRALTAIELGKLVWMDFKTFKIARTADDWICDYCRKNSYSIMDFNLVRRGGINHVGRRKHQGSEQHFPLLG